MQVKSHPIRGYRQAIGLYEVAQDLHVPGGVVSANPHLGIGGGEQFFIKNFSGSLRLLRQLNWEKIMNSCPHIDQVIKFSVNEGNRILSISKSKLMNKVIWMDNQLSIELRSKLIFDMKNLVYEKTQDMPHDPATEYFVCNDCTTVVIFPLQTAK